MDQPALFAGPVDRVQFILVRTPPTGWRLRIARLREGNLTWTGDVYEDLTLPEAADVVLVTLQEIDPAVD